jgi:hypothetical protein
LVEKRDIKSQIRSYNQFKKTASEVYDRILKKVGGKSIVPVHLIREEIGDRVTRTEFNDWMMELHRSHDLHLIGGGFVDSTQDQIQDSIYNDVLKTLYFAAEKLD